MSAHLVSGDLKRATNDSFVSTGYIYFIPYFPICLYRYFFSLFSELNFETLRILFSLLLISSFRSVGVTLLGVCGAVTSCLEHSSVEENTLSCSICPQVLYSDTFMWRSTCKGVRSGIILHYLVVCRSHVPVGRTKKTLVLYLPTGAITRSLSCIHLIRHSLQNRATCLSFVLA